MITFHYSSDDKDYIQYARSAGKPIVDGFFSLQKFLLTQIDLQDPRKITLGGELCAKITKRHYKIMILFSKT